MKIVLVGAGNVGYFLCKVLSEDGHSVTLIESSDEIADEAEENLDLRVIRGNGASAKYLSMAGVDSADFTIAMTAHDQVNIVACSLAKSLGAKNTIARVHDQVYSDNSIVNYQKHFNVDVLINPEALTAVELAKHVRNPHRVAVEEFAKGQIEAQEIRISRVSKAIGVPLKDLRLSSSVRIGYIERGDLLSVPTAESVLEPDDRITLFGAPDALMTARKFFTNEELPDNVRVVLYGATETAVSVIRRLSSPRFKIRVIEPDMQLCKTLAETFPRVTVINGSATSLQLLEEEQIGSADYVIACTKSDEENVMTCLQSKKLGAKYVELVINRPDYERVMQNISSVMNIESVASPHHATAMEIKKYVTDRKHIIVGSLHEGSVQFMELRVSEKSECAGMKVSQIKLPKACIIAALMNENGAKVPGADDSINAGDRLVIILDKTQTAAVSKMFCP